MDGFAVYKSPVGYLCIEFKNSSVVSLKKLAVKPKNLGEKNKLTEKVFEQLTEYFAGKRKKFVFPYVLQGTEFQKKVWAELEKIHYGETRSYGQIAKAIGNPKASRAVGMANNRNPIIIVVPCHRVIGSTGKLVGYGGGLKMKEHLLKLEEKNK